MELIYNLFLCTFNNLCRKLIKSPRTEIHQFTYQIYFHILFLTDQLAHKESSYLMQHNEFRLDEEVLSPS